MKYKTYIALLIVLGAFLANCRKDDEDSQNGLTFTLLDRAEDGSYVKLTKKNIVNNNEIIGYDSLQHIFWLNDEAKERILEYKTCLFAVAVDGAIVYFASFIPGYISQSCDTCIRIEPFSLNNKYRVELGYPGGIEFPNDDPRNEERIIYALKRDGKLMYIEL